MADHTIPIIGRTREWKTIQFVAAPLAKQTHIFDPEAPPDIVAWQFGYRAERSDGVPVQVLNVVEAGKVDEDALPQFLHMMQVLTKRLEEYRTCHCQPGTPCQLHQAQAKSA